MNFALGTSYQDVLDDPAIDAVILATPHTKHREQIEAAAARGKHVFCEKPFALSREDAQAAIAACRRAKVGLGVGHNRRRWPSVVAIKDLMATLQLGTVMFAEGNYSHDILANTPLDNWRAAPEETRAGGMTGMGIHLLGALSFLVGPIEKISALSTRRALPFAAGDTTQAFLSFRNGAAATISTTLKTPGFVWRLAIYGSDMWAESLSETRVVTCRTKGQPETFEVPRTNHIGMNIESFARAALGEGRFHIDDDGILHTVAALEAVFKSADANGAWQQIAG